MSDASKPARIRLGMVGGGRDAFIGGVHRIASRMDDHFALLAGAFSSTSEKALQSAAEIGVASDRAYSDYKEMAIREARLKEGIEAVSIVTPNHLHFPVAREFLKRGIHVICDKPLTSTLADAKKLVTLADSHDALFILTHNYTGYPMIRQAREMAQGGALGELRLVHVEYPQDWLSTRLEDTGQKQAGWRTDPERSGLGGCIGDIGTHAYNLATFVTGLTLESVCADIQTFVEGRELDDNAHVLLRFQGGARGMLWSSQVAPGNENGLKLRVYGSQGGIEWSQEEPNRLWYSPLGEATQLLTRAGPGASEAANTVSRVPAGHPEGYLEGFANIYTDAAAAIYAHREGSSLPEGSLSPSVHDGLDGIQFVAAVVRSSSRNGAWVSCLPPKEP